MKNILTPNVRRWAYGVTAAALAFAATVGWIPAPTAAAALPLLVAIFYVDSSTGEPRE